MLNQSNHSILGATGIKSEIGSDLVWGNQKGIVCEPSDPVLHSELDTVMI